VNNLISIPSSFSVRTMFLISSLHNTFVQWLKCTIIGGECYIQIWAPDNGRVTFPSIITIWGGGTLWAIN